MADGLLVSDAIEVGMGGDRAKRVHRTAEEKRRIVEATLVPGTSIARVARENGVNANQVFQWRYEHRKGVANRILVFVIVTTSFVRNRIFRCQSAYLVGVFTKSLLPVLSLHWRISIKSLAIGDAVSSIFCSLSHNPRNLFPATQIG